MIILASQSPRRKQMFDEAGLNYTVMPADIDENHLLGESPLAMVGRLAKEKAEAVAVGNPAAIVVAADTIVTFDEHILGKPADIADAERMIQMLSGRSHEVMTGVCICRNSTGHEEAWVAVTKVVFNDLSDDDIRHYLRISSPLDKAGGYAIQEHRDLLVASVEGLYSNVVGLPIEEVLEKLQPLMKKIST